MDSSQIVPAVPPTKSADLQGERRFSGDGGNRTRAPFPSSNGHESPANKHVLDQPELVCNRCQPLEARVAELEAALRSMSDENTRLADELRGARNTLRTVERQVAFYKGELSKQREDDPKSKEITSILETWVRVSGKKRAKIPLDGDRAKLVRGQMRTYPAEDLIDAIKGAGLIPYMAYGRRVAATEKDAKLSLELAQIIGKSKYVEENRDNYRRAKVGDIDRFWDGYQVRHAESLSYADVMLDKLMRRDDPELVVLLDDLEQDAPTNVVDIATKREAA